MNEKQETPWLKHAGEGTKAHEAALTYFYQGASRSIVAVGKALRKSPKLLERWSAKYSWVERSSAYDAWMEQEQLEAAALIARQEAEKRAQTEAHEREELCLIKGLLRSRAMDVLKLPLVKFTKTTKTDESGRPLEITVVMPLKCTIDSAARLIQTSLAVDAVIRNREAAQPEFEEEVVFDIVPYKSRK